jgi:DNA-binding NtrC family response regulator
MSIATPPSVLIIQNDPDLRALMVNTMHDLDAEVASASTGRLAAVMIAARHYDLALIDAALPDVSWIALASLAADRAIPAVLISSHPGTVAQLRHHDIPCLHAPFCADELRDVSRQAIRDGAINIPKVKASIADMAATWAVFRSDVGEAHRMGRTAREA